MSKCDDFFDSRIESTMSSKSVFFGPYDERALAALLSPRLSDAFEDDALPETVTAYGLRATGKTHAKR